MRFLAVLFIGSALFTGCRLDVHDESEASQDAPTAAEVLTVPGFTPKQLFDLASEERQERLGSLLRQFVALYATELTFDREPTAERNDEQVLTFAFDVRHRAAGTTFHVEVSVLKVGFVDVRFSDQDGQILRETLIEQVDDAWGPYANGLPHLGKTVKAYCAPQSGV